MPEQFQYLKRITKSKDEKANNFIQVFSQKQVNPFFERKEKKNSLSKQVYSDLVRKPSRWKKSQSPATLHAFAESNTIIIRRYSRRFFFIKNKTPSH